MQKKCTLVFFLVAMITVSSMAQTITEVMIPLYIQGNNNTNSTRVPFAFRATISGLTPNATYRYFNQVVISSDALTTNGAGNVIFANPSGFQRTSNPNMSTAGSYGTFTTNSDGSYTGWFITEPTANDRFTPGNTIYMRIMLNNGNNGTSVNKRLTLSNSPVKVINFGTQSNQNQGTGIYGNSFTEEKNFVVLYDNTNGNGRPIAATFIENDGTDNTTQNFYVPFYANSVNQQKGRWGTIIPNVNSNGIKYIGFLKLDNGSLIYATTDDDGNWNEVNTVNPNGGTSGLFLAFNAVGNLTINAGQQLEIPSTGQLTISGTLTNNGTLTIKSDATGTGSLIHNTTGVNATVERYIAGHSNVADEGWHILGSPVASFAISSSSFAPGTNDDLYAWDEVTKQWLNYKAGNPTHIEPGKGYLVAFETTSTKTFTGSLHVNSLTFTNLTKTGTNYSGWHLLGNPFASPLKWNDGNWALTQVAGTAKIWHSTNKSYTDLAPNDIIPMAQGFFVQVSSSSNSITIPAASRVHHNQAWYKASDVPMLKLIARPSDNSSAQEFKLRCVPESSTGFDFYHDSRFMPGYAPQLYALVDGEKLSTSAIPALDEAMVIPLGFLKNSHDHFVIELAENSLPAIVYLKDLFTGITHNLSQNPIYSFSAKEGDAPNRFQLVFASVGIEPNQQPAPSVYAIGKTLYLRHFQGLVNIEIYTIAGQLLHRTQTLAHELPLQVATGIYIVKVSNGSFTRAEKVFIR